MASVGPHCQPAGYGGCNRAHRWLPGGPRLALLARGQLEARVIPVPASSSSPGRRAPCSTWRMSTRTWRRGSSTPGRVTWRRGLIPWACRGLNLGCRIYAQNKGVGPEPSQHTGDDIRPPARAALISELLPAQLPSHDQILDATAAGPPARRHATGDCVARPPPTATHQPPGRCRQWPGARSRHARGEVALGIAPVGACAYESNA